MLSSEMRSQLQARLAEIREGRNVPDHAVCSELAMRILKAAWRACKEKSSRLEENGKLLWQWRNRRYHELHEKYVQEHGVADEHLMQGWHAELDELIGPSCVANEERVKKALMALGEIAQKGQFLMSCLQEWEYGVDYGGVAPEIYFSGKICGLLEEIAEIAEAVCGPFEV